MLEDEGAAGDGRPWSTLLWVVALAVICWLVVAAVVVWVISLT